MSIKDNKLKIAIVSDAIYPYNKGGKEKRIFEISTRLAKAGHDVHLYCMKWWSGKDNQRIENGVTLHAISKLYPLYSGQRRSIREAVLFSLSCLKLLKENFDIIDVDHMPHLVLFTTKLVALLKRKKLYATWNEVWGRAYWVEYMGLVGNFSYIIEWISARMPDTIIAVSEHTKNKLIHDLKITKNIYVAPNGIDLQLIRKIKPAKERSDVIFAGRLLSHKNVDVLVKSLTLVKKNFPQIKALIIGEGPEKYNIDNLIKKLRLQSNIKLLGFLKEQNDLYAMMKASKIFAFPSTREGFGIAALEANACNIPVITTNGKDNATKYLISNGENGYVTQLTPEKIAEKIQNILILRTTKNNNNQFNQVKNYDWNQISKTIERLYIQ